LLSDIFTKKKAANLFEKGVKEERRGHMFEAIRFYRNAVHLDPDIEQKMAQSAGWTQHGPKDKGKGASGQEELSSAADELAARTELNQLLREWGKVLRLQDGQEVRCWLLHNFEI
jgi:hypothetical protein